LADGGQRPAESGIESKEMIQTKIRRAVDLPSGPLPDRVFVMSNREKVIEAVRQLPEDLPVEEMLREVELVLGVRRAIEEADKGEVVSAAEAKRLLREWVSQS
jgi:hypothetical protein